ncbi:MAG: DUF2249 domain-containing protein [SAR324 cluster bacterium]|nr:DUF2249 domain-containing protein [SAR324 cluster bacterium]MBL7034472.1 DUF2249 domain-containing protein [SAR324 cluster bacterium]
MIPDSVSCGYSVITVDCRDLEPPEPLVLVLEAIEKLEPYEVVKMLHRHSPKMLFPKLEERKMQTHLKEFEDGSIELWIWKEDK